MVSRSIFLELSPAELLEVSDLLTFNPVVSHQPFKFLNSLDNDAKLAWLDNNRDAVSSEFCRVGSWSFGSTKSYREIIVDFAFKISAEFQAGDAVESVERAIVLKLWNDAVSKLTPDQVEELKSRAQEIATKYGKSFGSEITGFAALSAAQLSGFGVYVLGSTILGALNGALGLGLSFGAFTGLSSLISTVIGPVGWAALGVFTIVRLGSPNYKKLLPVIVLIASKRSLASPDSVREATADTEGLLENVTDVGCRLEKNRHEIAEEVQVLAFQIKKLRKEPKYTPEVAAQLADLRKLIAAKKQEIKDLDRQVCSRPFDQLHESAVVRDSQKSTEEKRKISAPEFLEYQRLKQAKAGGTGRDLPVVTKRLPSSSTAEQNEVRASATKGSGKHASVDLDTVRQLTVDLDLLTETTAVAKRKKRAGSPVSKYIPSKMDRRLFDLKPENKLLAKIAAECTGQHFLDLSDEDQAAVRAMEKERRQLEALEAQEALRSIQQVKSAEDRNELVPDRSSGRERQRRKLRNRMRAIFPNLEFSDRALDRVFDFGNTDLDTAFHNEFRFLDTGSLADKHHVPDSSPKLFQRDCGRSGKVYYRRGERPNSVHIELIGDKNTQSNDFKAMRS